jgi:hypothetical protein
MATIVESDLVEVKVTGYEIQRQVWSLGRAVWLVCFVTPGYPVWEAKSYPCRYTDLSEARARLAKFRERHPEITYRMVRDVTITEVVE